MDHDDRYCYWYCMCVSVYRSSTLVGLIGTCVGESGLLSIVRRAEYLWGLLPPFAMSDHANSANELYANVTLNRRLRYLRFLDIMFSLSMRAKIASCSAADKERNYRPKLIRVIMDRRGSWYHEQEGSQVSGEKSANRTAGDKYSIDLSRLFEQSSNPVAQLEYDFHGAAFSYFTGVSWRRGIFE